MNKASAAISATLMILSACGGGGSDSPTQADAQALQCELPSNYSPVSAANSSRVTYAGTNLIVDGISHQAAAPETWPCVKGAVIVYSKSGKLSELSTLVQSFQLRIESSLSHLDALVLTVPVGFEAQWTHALKANSLVQSAHHNSVATPQ